MTYIDGISNYRVVFIPDFPSDSTLAHWTDTGLEVGAKAVYEIGNLIRAAVARLGKLIDSHPWRARWDAEISRVQMLMKVIDAEADNGDVHSLYAFGA
jgi:hypothetical protein